MFSERHEFDVSEAELLNVWNQLTGQFAVAEVFAPRTNVQFVYRHG